MNNLYNYYKIGNNRQIRDLFIVKSMKKAALQTFFVVVIFLKAQENVFFIP